MLRHGLVRPSFIQPRPQRELRELTRHRTNFVRERATLVNRVQKVLEGTNRKLPSTTTRCPDPSLGRLSLCARTLFVLLARFAQLHFFGDPDHPAPPGSPRSPMHPGCRIDQGGRSSTGPTNRGRGGCEAAKGARNRGRLEASTYITGTQIGCRNCPDPAGRFWPRCWGNSSCTCATPLVIHPFLVGVPVGYDVGSRGLAPGLVSSTRRVSFGGGGSSCSCSPGRPHRGCVCAAMERSCGEHLPCWCSGPRLSAP